MTLRSHFRDAIGSKACPGRKPIFSSACRTAAFACSTCACCLIDAQFQLSIVEANEHLPTL